MAGWAVQLDADGSVLMVKTPNGERSVDECAYESSALHAPFENVRGVSLLDLWHCLRPSLGHWQLKISRASEKWFDPDYADAALTIRRPTVGRSRKYEVEFEYWDEASNDNEDDETAARRIAALLGPFAKAQGASVLSVELHPGAAFPPWPYVIVLSVPIGGWTVEGVFHLVEGAVALLHAIGSGTFRWDVAANVLRAGHGEALLGQPESICLDVKQQLYDLGTPTGGISLTHSVARFANAEQGGVVVFGMKGKRVPGGEIISSLAPVAVDNRDILRCTQVLDRRLFPPVDGLDVFKVDLRQGGNLLVIVVPPQPEELKPFLVHGAIVDGKVEGAFLSIVRRRGEHSLPITAPAIHTMLAAGRALLRRGQLPGN